MSRKVALTYLRQSRTDEGSVSLDVQDAKCRHLPEVKDCDTVVPLRDEDISGGTERRPGFQSLLQRIRDARGPEDVAVVAAYDVSRISRDAEVLLGFHKLMKSRPWIKVVFADGTHFGITATARMTFAQQSVFAEFLRLQTGEKIQATYQHLNAQGKATGMPPYGYRREKKDSEVKFVIEPDEAAVVRAVFEQYATGHISSRDIAARLNAEGIVKPGSRTNGLGWVPDTIVDMVQNVAYVGKTYTVSRARREGEVIAAAWPAIIEQPLFDRAQIVLAKNYRLPGASGITHGGHVFAGLLTCNHCGRPMRAIHDRSGVYYHCRRDLAMEQRCKSAGRGVREGRLLPWATALFDSLDKLNEKELAEARAALPRRISSPDAVAQVDASLDRQRKLFTWGHITEAAYLREAERLTAMRDELRGALVVEPTIHLDGMADAWAKGNPARRRQLLMQFFDRLMVSDGEITDFVPRADRVGEVVDLVKRAIPSGVIHDVPTDHAWRGKGRPRKNTCKSGKGGIRTLEGVSHPLPA